MDRRDFVLGLATATAVLTLDACSDDEGRPSGDELGDSDGVSTESGTSESTSETTSEESTSEASSTETTEESTESSTSESTSEESTSTDTTEESTSDTTEESTSDTTETGDPICPNGGSGTILMNHGHSMLVPAVDVQIGAQKVYNIQGGANHNHQVTLTAADFVQLQLGNVVMKTSTFLQAHDHDVLVSCLL